MSKIRHSGDTDDRLWFRAISEHIYVTSGITLHGENRSIYERRVAETARDNGIKTLGEYYMHLRFHVHAQRYTQELIERITTGETYFFRESRQLTFFLQHLLMPRLEQDAGMGPPLRIWSAGCSTGEEPYTLAMMAIDQQVPNSRVTILGGDINNHALDLARVGAYRESAFRVISPESRIIHFSDMPNGMCRVNERVRSYVEFTWMNLIDGDALAVLPPPDIIFCRNVLIYFDRAAKQKAIANLHQCLNPGGILLLGHAESLLNLDNDFLPEQLHGELVYRKVGP